MTQLMDKQRPPSDVVHTSSTARAAAMDGGRWQPTKIGLSRGSRVLLRGINSAQQAYSHDWQTLWCSSAAVEVVTKKQQIFVE